MGGECRNFYKKELEFSYIELNDVLKTPDDSEECYILEVDLHVPDEVHD